MTHSHVVSTSSYVTYGNSHILHSHTRTLIQAPALIMAPRIALTRGVATTTTTLASLQRLLSLAQGHDSKRERHKCCTHNATARHDLRCPVLRADCARRIVVVHGSKRRAAQRSDSHARCPWPTNDCGVQGDGCGVGVLKA